MYMIIIIWYIHITYTLSSYTLSVASPLLHLQEMLERQLEYERVRLEAESRKACLESQEKVATAVVVN